MEMGIPSDLDGRVMAGSVSKAIKELDATVVKMMPFAINTATPVGEELLLRKQSATAKWRVPAFFKIYFFNEPAMFGFRQTTALNVEN